MRYRINNEQPKPAYIQLYEMIRDDITAGIFKFGNKLPSKRAMAENVEISVITVAHAYELLCDEGYVTAREKSGYFVSYRVDDFYKVADKEIRYMDLMAAPPVQAKATDYQHVYKQGAGELSFNVLSRTVRKVLLDYAENVLEKSPNQGIFELRYEISRYLARSVGINAEPDNIVIGAGAEYLYGLVAQLFDDKKSVAIEKPGYEKIKKVYDRFSYEIDELDLGNEGIVSEQLFDSCAFLLHVTPFHSFPSNVSASISKKHEYLKWAHSGRYIVEDNFDSELTVSDRISDTLYSLSDSENVIYINTFSKTIAPSIRVGYMVLPKSLEKVFIKKLGFYSCTVPLLEQLVLYELLRSGDFERHINKVRRKLRK